MITPEQWLERLDDVQFCTGLKSHCGYYSDDFPARLSVWRAALLGFRDRFGSRPVFVTRCPGRVNLRGMHVDTHGGYLNLMTHQRETLLVASTADDATCTFVNADRNAPECSFKPERDPDPSGDSWEAFINSPSVIETTKGVAGSWSMYLHGCAQTFRARTGAPAAAIHAYVASDLPRGAALSASHALCTAALLSFERASHARLSPCERILAARDAEWYAGARTGTSDQSAMILGHKNTMLAGPLPPSDLDLTRLHEIPWPDDLALVVAQSFTVRNLSGKNRISYTTNRFAYSLALEILRHVIGVENGSIKHLYQITETRFGKRRLLDAIVQIPEHLPLDELRRRCRATVFDEAYERYFGNVDASERPKEVPLRGPLVFGIAESERARLFGSEVSAGNYAMAGALMTIGHAGDRRRGPKGESTRADVNDTKILEWEESPFPIATIPGAYGASTPALDSIVDAALEAGAYGASLTGAGLAGVVLALCPRAEAETIRSTVAAYLASEGYAATAGLDAPMTESDADAGVVINRAPNAACVMD